LLPETEYSLIFKVNDTGVGIAEVDHESIFQSFEQTDMGRSKEGTGLGLAICRKYVELMGGSLFVESELGKGSMFTFSLPVVRVAEKEVPVKPKKRKVLGIKNIGKKNSEPDHNESEQSEAENNQKGLSLNTSNIDECRILVVDDKETNRDVLTRLLAPIGISLKEAADGQEALDIFYTWQPQMVLMDIRMPVMDGVEATKRIKASDRGDKTFVIVVSASAMEEQRIEVMASGADAFIRKPFQEAEIFDAISTYLGVEFIYEAEPSEVSLSQSESSASSQHQSGSSSSGSWSSEKERISGILTSDELANTPETLLQEMFTAVEGGYIERLKAGIETIAKTDAELANRLQELADNYEYEQLMRLFKV
ncbi:MAG: response regulator, partial [Desulfamplus sp.]|nr:response regulator [Desulfamplus sp.]